METLPAVLAAVARQRVDADVEIVCVDTASTDGTVRFLRERGATVASIARDAFNHGTTRNAAIGQAHGEFVVLLSQDAEPADDHWLAALIAPLLADPHVAGCTARQELRATAGAVARQYHEQWAGSSLEPRRSAIEGQAAFDALGPFDKLHACLLDNVCSCIRRSVWERIPFTACAIAEDVAWARDVLLAGFALEYVPSAVVLHSHDRSAAYEFRRTAVLHHRLHELFGLRTIPTRRHLAVAIASCVRLHLRCRQAAAAGTPVESLGRALALAVAWPLGQFVGGRRGARHVASQRVEGI